MTFFIFDFLTCQDLANQHHNVQLQYVALFKLLCVLEVVLFQAQQLCHNVCVQNQTRQSSQHITLPEQTIRQNLTCSQISWIIYNILVGIYYNWLRLAPFILHYLTATKRDKIEDLRRMIENIKLQQQRLIVLLKRNKSRRFIPTFSKNKQQGLQFGNQDMLEQMNQFCNDFKFSTQVFSGEFLAAKRILKTDKQNNLADDLAQDLAKTNRGHFDGVKMMVINGEIEKMAETIADRIEVVNYLRKNNMKIDERILKPLKNIFASDKNLKRQQNMIDLNTQKIIKRIKTKFNIQEQPKKNISRKWIGQKNKKRIPTIKKIILEQQHRQKQNEQKQQRPSIDSSFQSDIEDVQEKLNALSKVCLSINLIPDVKEKTNKKIGFFSRDISDHESQSQDDMKDDVIRSRNNISKRAIHNWKKGRTNKKIQFLDSQRSRSNKMSKKSGNRQKSQSKSKQLQKQRQRIQSKATIQKDKSQKKINQSIKKLTSKEMKSSRIQLTSQNNYESSDEEADELQENKSKLAPQKSNKQIKPGRLIKKKKLLKFSELFHHIDLDHFDQELRAEESVITKKRKILSLFRSLEANGIIKTKSIKKIVNHAKKLEFQLKNPSKKTNIKNKKDVNQDFPITSFFRIPESEKKVKQSKVQQCFPYTYLTLFNKQALQNWKKQLEKLKVNAKQQVKALDFQKHRTLGLDFDLEIPLIKKEEQFVIRNSQSRKQKQKLGFEIGLQIIKRWQQSVMKQKGLGFDHDKEQNQ